MEKRIPQAILLPRTEDSFPWGAADRQLVPTYLEKYGYEEEEYLYSGEADVYTLKDGQAQVKLSNARCRAAEFHKQLGCKPDVVPAVAENAS